MEKNIKSRIGETEKQLQFAVVIGLFFPVILEAFFSFNGSDQKDVSETVLKSGVIIFILLCNYLLFEWRKSKLSEFDIALLSWIYLSTIACYASVILFFGFVANGDIHTANWFVQIFYPIVLFGAMYIPVTGAFVIIWNFLRQSFKE